MLSRNALKRTKIEDLELAALVAARRRKFMYAVSQLATNALF
jgi:predicted transcriptional regulator